MFSGLRKRQKVLSKEIKRGGDGLRKYAGEK